MKHRKLLLAGVSLVVICLGVLLLDRLDEHMPARTPLSLATESPSNAPHASKASPDQPEGDSAEPNNSSPSPSSNKQPRPARLAESPERLSTLSAITPSELETHDASTLAARSQRSRTLNERLEKRLEQLHERQAQASDAEQEELQHAIALLERNRDLRAMQQVAQELPRRELR